MSPQSWIEETWLVQIENTLEAMAVFREHMRLHPADYEEDSDSETLSWGQ